MRNKFSVGQKVSAKYQGQKHTGTVVGYEDMYDEYIVMLDTNGQRVQVKAENLS